MKASDLLEELRVLIEEHGDHEVLIAGPYDHYEINYINYSEAMSKRHHICIRVKKNEYEWQDANKT